MPKNLGNLIIPSLQGLYFHKSLQSHIEKDISELINKGGKYLVIDDEAVIRDLDLSHRYGLSPDWCSMVFANSQHEYNDLTDL